MENQKNTFDNIKLKPRIDIEESYFKNFEIEILEKIKNEKKVFRLNNHKPLFWISSVAAAATIIFVLNLFTQPNNISFQDLSKNEIHTYLCQNIDDFEEEHLVTNLTFKSFNKNMFTKDELAEYITNEDIEIEY